MSETQGMARFRLATLINLGALATMLLLGVAVVVTWLLARQIRNEVVDAYGDELAAMVQLNEADSALWRLQYGFDRYVNGDAETRRRVVEEEGRWYALLEGRLAAYAAGRRTAEEQLALAKLRAAYVRYKEARPKFFELVAAGRLDEAQAWRALTTTPYGAATVAAMERQVDIERLGNEAVQQHAETVIGQARWLIVIIGASLSVFLLAGFFLTRFMLRPLLVLRERAQAALSETLGEDMVSRQPRSGNEIAAVEASFELLVARFTAQIDSLRLSDEALRQERAGLEETVAQRTEKLRQTLAERERQTREIALRGELGEVLQTCLDLGEAARIVERYLPMLFPSAAGCLYLIDERHEAVVAAAMWGEASQRPTRQALELADCWALRRGKAHFIDGDETALRCAHLTEPLAGPSLCVPIAAHGETIGLLHLVCVGCVAEQDNECGLRVDTAERTAAQLGMAIANLRLRESLKQQSIRDTLTGLYNRRHLESVLPRELARAMRGERPLAVFMLDVDHFKKFNDTYGHEAGDAVLRALGKVLQENCRQGDTACRFGGEEFTVLLPDADEAAARDWGERLMQRVRKMEVLVGTQPLPPVTISLGLALHPRHCSDAETLLQAADVALYEAKHAGRDRLAVWGETPTVVPITESES